MKRFPFARQLWLVLLVSCQPPAPVLELSVSTLRVDGEATVTVTATNGDMTPGTGTVALSTTLGMLDSTSLALTEGSGRTKLRCPRSTPGCAANGSLEVTARWTSSSGALTQTVTVKLTDPPPNDGGRVDAGADAGRDAGVDAGVVDAGAIDSGVILDGTSLRGLGDVFVFGRLGEPRTVGFTPFSSPGAVLLGFDRMPEHPALINDRLVYVRDGVAFVWSEDYVDGGPPVPVDAGEPDAGDPDAGELDAGELDAGELDAGEVDAGEPDAGLDAGAPDAGSDGGVENRFGAFPLFGPERNDPVVFNCRGRVGEPDAGVVVALIPTPAGSLWVGCGLSSAGGVVRYFKGETSFAPPPRITPLAADNDAVLGGTNDGGLYLLSPTPLNALITRPRAFSRSARATGTGFELLSFDPDVAKCNLATITVGGDFSELALPATFPQGLGCLEGVLFGRRDAVLYPSLGPQLGFRAFAFTRPVVMSDGGVDGGAADAGTVDAGRVDAGPVDAGGPPVTVAFTEGPLSDFDAGTISIDFSFPVELVIKP